MKFILFLISIFLIYNSLFAQFQNVEITSIPAFYQPNEPCIFIDRKNPFNILAASAVGNIYISNDTGKTFVADTSKTDYGNWSDPSVIIDNKGNYYYFHLSGTRKGNSSDRIVCNKSGDGKIFKTISTPGYNPRTCQERPWALYDSRTNSICLTYIEFDVYGSTLKGDSTRVYFTRSKDEGLTWSSPIRINKNAGNCSDQDLSTQGATTVIDNDGIIYVTWAFNNAIYQNISGDGGKTWLPTENKIAEQPGGWDFIISGVNMPNGLPVAVVDKSNGKHKNTLYVFWADQRNGINNTDVFMTKSGDKGKTWSSPKKVNQDKGEAHQFHTWACIDETTGYLYCIYYDRRNLQHNYNNVYLSISKDGGETFTDYCVTEQPFLTNDKDYFGDFIHIDAFKGIVRPVWIKAIEGKNSVYTAIINFAE